MDLRNIWILLPIVVLFLIGCRKEPTTWNSRVEAPLLKGGLELKDLLPGNRLNSDSTGALRLVRTDTLIELPLDSILRLPDTSLFDSYVAPVGGNTVNPGQFLINNSNDQELKLAKAELVLAILNEGELQYRIKSTLPERTLYEYRVPSATKNGQPLTVQRSIPPGSQSDPSIVKGAKKLKGYRLDLRGPSGGSVNRFRTEAELRTDPNGQSFTLQANDSIRIRNSFKGLEPRLAKGYFGNRQVSEPYQEKDIELFEKIRSGALDIDSVNVRFTIDNGIGADARILLEELRSIGKNGNVDLSHPMIGSPINIGRAQYQNGNMDHTLHEEVMTPQNSNIDLFLESLPERIGHDLALELNPLGDVSNGNDVMLLDHSVHVRMRIGLPLSLIANDLTLADTLDWDFGGRRKGELKEGTLYLNVDNGFPLASELSLILHDENGERLGSLFEERTIAAATTDASWKVTGTNEQELRISVPPEKADLLRKADQASIIARFNTPSGSPHIDLYESYGLDVKASMDLRYQNRIE